MSHSFLHYDSNFVELLKTDSVLQAQLQLRVCWVEQNWQQKNRDLSILESLKAKTRMESKQGYFFAWNS